MVDEEGKKDKFEFDDTGEAVGYISLDDAGILALQEASDNPRNYGIKFLGTGMVYEVSSASETDDYYSIFLSVTPAGGFRKRAGEEEFHIGKEGSIAFRQVNRQPSSIPILWTGGAVAAAAVVIVAVVVLSQAGSNAPAPAPALVTAPQVVVPTVVAGSSELEKFPISMNSSGIHQAIIPMKGTASLVNISRLDIKASSLPPESEVVIKQIPISAAPSPPTVALFVRSMDISVEGAGDTKALPGTIEFQVKKQWLEGESISLENVALFRHDGDWNELTTSYLGSMVGAEDELYERFSAETPGFSIFAIGIRYDETALLQATEVAVPPTSTQIPVVTSTATASATAVPDIATVVPETPTSTAIPTATPKPKPTAAPVIPVPLPKPTSTSIPTPTPVPSPTAIPVPTREAVSSEPSLKVSGKTFRVGDKVTVTYSGMGGKKDGWIGMFRPEDSDSTFKGYQKIGADGSGSIEFTAPKQTGEYEFRIFSTIANNPYNRESVSEKLSVLTAFTPTPTATVTPTPTPDRSGDVDGGRLDNNEPATGAINYVGDSDEWNFNGAAGMGLTVSVNPSSNSDIDAYVELINLSGNLETQSGGAGGSTNAIISGWILQQSGQYTVRVSSASGTGGYTIEVSAIAAAKVVLPTPTLTPLVVALLPAPTPTITPTPTVMYTSSPTPTSTWTPTSTPTIIPTSTRTPTPTPTATSIPEFNYLENFDNSSSGTKKLYDDQYHTISGNPENVTLETRLRTQNSFSEAWLGWGNTGLEFTTQGFNITKLKVGTETHSLSASISPSDWHEYKIVRTSSELRLYVDGQLKFTKQNSGWSTGPIKLGGVCPYGSCTAYMEIDWISVTESDDSDLTPTPTPTSTATPTPTPTPTAIPTPTPVPVVTPVPGELVYACSGGGWDICVNDGSQLTSWSGHEGWPQWSPDGLTISYRSSMGTDGNSDGNWKIWLMNQNGVPFGALKYTEYDELTEGKHSWSPDGKWMAVGKSDGLSIIRTDSYPYSYFRTMGSSHEVLDPDWSPDGTKIAFSMNSGIHVAEINWDCMQDQVKLQAGNCPLTSVSNLSPIIDSVTGRWPDWSPDGSKIVFESLGGFGAIYTMNANGTDLERISEDESTAFSKRQPAWGPDGEHIVFSYNYQIHVMRADGSGLTQLTEHGIERGYPSWRSLPEDRFLLSRLNESGDPAAGVYIANRLGGSPSEIDARFDLKNPTVSRGGRTIAGLVDSDCAYGRTGMTRLCVIYLDSLDLWDSLHTCGIAPVAHISYGSYAWSPDSKSLALDLKTNLGNNPGDFEDEGTSLFIANDKCAPSGFNTTTGLGGAMIDWWSGPAIKNISWPAWSPDGQLVAFYVKTGNAIYGITNQMTMLVDTSGLENIRHLTFSSDSSKLLFVAESGGISNIYMASSLTGSETQPVPLSDTSSHQEDPRWSPNDAKILFSGTDDPESGNWDVYRMNSNGSVVEKLTDHPGADRQAKWSPDGSEIVYISERNGWFDVYIMDSEGGNNVSVVSTGDYWAHPQWIP